MLFCINCYALFIAYIVAVLSFDKSAYSAEENDGSVQFILSLSIPSSFDINVQVLSINALASGEYSYVHIVMYSCC